MDGNARMSLSFIAIRDVIVVMSPFNALRGFCLIRRRAVGQAVALGLVDGDGGRLRTSHVVLCRLQIFPADMDDVLFGLH